MFFSCDSANKCIQHAVKLASWQHIDRVMCYLVDNDYATGNNEDMAETSDVALRKVDPTNDVKEKKHGLCADVGGGVS